MLIDPREMLSCCLFQVKFTVLLEMCLVLEALPTLCTHKGFFSCVDSLVSVGVSALKHFPHWEHTQGFSPVWLCWCWVSVEKPLKPFPHCMHSKGLSPAWALW